MAHFPAAVIDVAKRKAEELEASENQSLAETSIEVKRNRVDKSMTAFKNCDIPSLESSNIRTNLSDIINNPWAYCNWHLNAASWKKNISVYF